MAKAVYATTLSPRALLGGLGMAHAGALSPDFGLGPNDLILARHLPPSNGTIISCNTVCTRISTPPRPGDKRERGYLTRICTNNLTGRIVSRKCIVPPAPCV